MNGRNMEEIWIFSDRGLADLQEIGIRVPNSTTKKRAGYIWRDAENRICSAGAIAFSNESELKKLSFPLKSNIDYDKISRIVKFEERRR